MRIILVALGIIAERWVRGAWRFVVAAPLYGWQMTRRSMGSGRMEWEANLVVLIAVLSGAIGVIGAVYDMPALSIVTCWVSGQIVLAFVTEELRPYWQSVTAEAVERIQAEKSDDSTLLRPSSPEANLVRPV